MILSHYARGGPGVARSALGDSIVGIVERTVAALLTAGLAAGVLVGAVASPGAVATESPRPTAMVSLGDSITRGFNACGFYVDCTQRSWSTGGDTGVASQWLRLLGLGAPTGQANFAHTGARAQDLLGQAASAVSARADYLTIEIGANDVCRATEDDVTPVDLYRSQIQDALAVLKQGLPGALVFFASVPDLKRLWEVGHVKRRVREIWSRLDVCQSMLVRPNSLRSADTQRRARLRGQVIAYNRALAVECAAYGPSCRFDGNAVFRTQFRLGQLSKWDYFHPNRKGQAALAEATWAAGFFGGQPPS